MKPKPQQAILCALCLLLFTAAAFAANKDDKLATQSQIEAKLRNAAKRMKELAEKDLPEQRLGGRTQDKEETVINLLDEVIRMIIDAQNNQGPNTGCGPIGPDPHEMIRVEPPDGNIERRSAPPGQAVQKGAAWSPLIPGREDGRTTRGPDSRTIPEYEKLVEKETKKNGNC